MFRFKYQVMYVGCVMMIINASLSYAADEEGLAAVYSNRLHGRTTACGERYDKNKLTTAHKTLPCGSKVKITNPNNGKSVVLRVNDRGPNHAGRIVDISLKAAKSLGLKGPALIPVELEVVEKGKK